MDHNHLQDLTLDLAAARLRALHVPGDPLVLVNAWDVASAREVVAAGGQAIGTSSAAVAASLGEPDDNTMPIAVAFGAIARIASSVAVPVTADVEAGYDLDADELVGALLAAGAVGCNLEDTDHRRPGHVLDVETAAARLATVRDAIDRTGIGVVLNARIDVLAHVGAGGPDGLADVVRRAHRYVDAGADCVFPLRVADPAVVEQLVRELDAPVNVGLPPGTTVAQMADAGAGRISFGPQLQRRAMADLQQRARELLGTPAPSARSVG